MAKSSKPNILLITTDQQRYDTCGPMAPPFMRTPHFDHLAREGITFSKAYADCPICVASRTSIMTGQFVTTHGNAGNGPTNRFIGHDNTLPACLRQAGYQSVAIGKMHFTPQRNRHGFDEMLIPDDYYRQMHQSGQPIGPMRHGLGQNEMYPTMATVPEAMTLTSWTAERSLEFIKVRRDPTQPFFLWTSFSKPHPPLDPPEPYYSMYRNCPVPEPVYGDWSDDEHAAEAFKRRRQSWSADLLPPEILREARVAYLGLITQVDYNIGRIFAALQDEDLFKDTLILYCSDHGEYLGDHHACSKVFWHEPSSHIPMVLRLPQTWSDRRHGTTVDQTVTVADILPTLVAAAGAKLPPKVDGIDLIHLARHGGRSRYIHGLSADGTDPDSPHYLAVTDGRWKYIYYPEGGSEELFDLQTDPRELHNLAAEKSASKQRDRLRTEILRQHRGSRLVRNNKLIRYPINRESVADRRNRSWPGYHTELSPVDVRH